MIVKLRTLPLALGLAVALAVAALGIDAAVDSPHTLMSRDDFQRAEVLIEAEVRRDMEDCRAGPGATRELCRAGVRADERVRKADLVAQYHGTVDSAREARLARVSGDYDIASTKCAVHAAGPRGDCLQAAREESVRAAAQARLGAT